MPVSLADLHTRVLLLDVEGTTTPIEFVYDVLFPYARSHAARFLERGAASPECQEAVARLRQERALEENAADLPAAPEGTSVAPVLPYVHWLMDRDRKSPGLKALQGLIWKSGFESGELNGQVYADVEPAFGRWRGGGRRIYIYSSGSVLAQRLLFGATNAGDLTPALSGYFDTAVGPKMSADSYRAIANRVAAAPSDMLFVSDVVAELDAAATAGLRTALCVRKAGSSSDPGSHPRIESFDEIVD